MYGVRSTSQVMTENKVQKLWTLPTPTVLTCKLHANESITSLENLEFIEAGSGKFYSVPPRKLGAWFNYGRDVSHHIPGFIGAVSV